MKKILFLFLFLFLAGCQSERPQKLGIHGAQLYPCSEKPHCRSSYSAQKDEKHYIKPLRMIESKELAYKKIQGILSKYKSAKIIKMDPSYIHAEFTSSIFKFIDDIEFHFVWEKKMIHIKSSSRIGYWDLGSNKKRIEEIKFKYYQNDF